MTWPRAQAAFYTKAGACTGTGPCDTSNLGTGHNWITHETKTEGLGPYIHAIAHALERNGHEKSEAIAMAISAVKRWAAGEDHVTAQTQERARAALAHWDDLKSRA